MLQEGETALHRAADGGRLCGSVEDRMKAALALIDHGGTELLLEANEVLQRIFSIPYGLTPSSISLDVHLTRLS